MERITKLAETYAKAFFSSIEHQSLSSTSFAREAEGISERKEPLPLSQAAQHLSAFSSAWKENIAFQRFLLNPAEQKQERRRVLISALASSGMHPLLVSFLSLLFENTRITLLPAISAAFSQIVDKQNQLVDVSVTTARKLVGVEHQEICKSIEKHITGIPRYSFEVEPQIVGGVIIEWEGKKLDGSLRSKMEQLKKGLFD